MDSLQAKSIIRSFANCADSCRFFFHFSRDELKTKWGVSDFIKAFIKFHGHVYLSKSLEKLSPLREKLEEQFKVRVKNKKFLSLI